MTVPPPAPPTAASTAPAAPGSASGTATAPLVRTTGPEVIGDGTTGLTRARARWRRWRVGLAIAAGVLVAALAASLITPRSSDLPLAPDNPQPLGSRAAAQILERQGVTIHFVRSHAEALRLAGPDTTLLVTTTHLLEPQQVERLAATDADIVLTEPTWDAVETFTDGRLTSAPSYVEEHLIGPACRQPDAMAANRVETTGGGFTAVDGADGVHLCFPLPGLYDTGTYAVVEDGDRRVVAMGDAGLMTNARLADEGHAALTLRTLGRHEVLVWYAPTYGDTGEAEGPAVTDVVPRWAGPLALLLALLVLVTALWRGRSFGRIVAEPLPVTVRATEAVHGRGRLYRRTRSRGHASAALRAGTARRTAARLGLARSAGAPEVIDALARATGRDGREVAALLYGPPPTDDAGLLDLARQLDELESEVHRS